MINQTRQSVAKRIFAVAVVTLSSLQENPAAGLPIGFGVNQGSLEYLELKGKDFVIYHDARTPNEALVTLRALEAAQPSLELWFAKKRASQLPVVMSAVTPGNPSFANFITDAIELQTAGDLSRDLAWHEYVHTSMYLHLRNWFGPAGALLHLPWMPAWWIEGLAESLSVSTGSATQAGVERYQAMSGDWPTFDRLHSLYAKGGFAARGYATAGGFVSWILRQRGDVTLAPLHEKFRDLSMVWWWPWALTPWNGFMPMDKALTETTNGKALATEESTRALYESYKRAAAAHWGTAASRPPLASQAVALQASVARLDHTAFLRTDKAQLVSASPFDEDSRSAPLSFTGLGDGSFATIGPKTHPGSARHAYVRRDVAWLGEVTYSVIPSTGTGARPAAQKRGYITGLRAVGSSLVWVEQKLELTMFCVWPNAWTSSPRSIRCPTTRRQPQFLEFAGSQGNGGISVTRYALVDREQTLLGDVSSFGVLDPSSPFPTFRWTNTDAIGRPLQLAWAGDQAWVLSADRAYNILRQVDAAGRCVRQIRLSDHVEGVWGFSDGTLALALYQGGPSVVYRASIAQLSPTACEPALGHTSPLVASVQANKITGRPLNLPDALAASHLWFVPTKTSDIQPSTARQVPAPFFSDGDVDREGVSRHSRPAAWRGRPVLAFPWIGAEDALGLQYGVISIPLMDHMQNETVRATALYGTASRFPSLELSLVSTRFAPTLTLDGYRTQTFNGVFRFRDESGAVQSETLYYDERGARFTANLILFPWQMNLTAGIKSAELRPYLGPSAIRKGPLQEPFAAVTKTSRIGSFQWFKSFNVRAAPGSWNENFDYMALGTGTNLSRALPLWRSTMSLGLDYSGTRGKKMRFLREFYSPLRTFVPGSGGGYNKNSFGLIGDGSLFSARYGDTQGRLAWNWVIPLIPNLDKLINIFYIDRLDLTAFVNHGGAWRQKPLPESDELVTAHGYNLDLQLDVKGIRFNVGTGIGQVVGRSFEAYITTGFDAIF